MENKDKNVSNMSLPVPTLRQQAEAIILQKNSALPLDTLDDLPPETVSKMLHELCVHQIELEMQNEELLRAQLLIDHAVVTGHVDLRPIAHAL
jgi:hypothetical protein